MSGDLIITDPAVAIDRLRAGGVVALPTETVYGLAADADQPAAIEQVFVTKGRPRSHPLIVHLAGADGLASWASDVPDTAAVLAATCWPGPLTLIVRRRPGTGDAITGGRDTVALRVPAHPLTEQVLRAFRGVAAPSANRFGAVSPTTARHVLDDLGGLLVPGRDAILDGGPCPIGVESTIVDCVADPPQVLRPGGISTEEIERILDGRIAPPSGPSRASGMLERHYAPGNRVVVAESDTDARTALEVARTAGQRVELLDFTGDLVEAARNLYTRLRDADRDGVETVVALMPPPRGLGHAIRDRLVKAAAGRHDPGPAPPSPAR